MTVEEKLEKFYQVSMENAQEVSAAELEAYQASLEKIFQEHKEDALRQSELHLKTEQEESRRLSNMEVSREMLQMKHELRKKEEALTDTLFEEVEKKIEEFHGSPAYWPWLKAQIEDELSFDPQAEMCVYIDASDRAFLPEIVKMDGRKNVEFRLAEGKDGFMGGSYAVILSRNIIIDHSLKRKLADIRDTYQLREEL